MPDPISSISSPFPVHLQAPSKLFSTRPRVEMFFQSHVKYSFRPFVDRSVFEQQTSTCWIFEKFLHGRFDKIQNLDLLAFGPLVVVFHRRIRV
jgi:hypothetical protein